MKKIILFTAGILLFTNAFSQIKQGTWMAGGNLGYSKNIRHLDSYSDGPTTGKNIYKTFNLNLDAGYFIKDNLAIGLSPNYSYNKTTEQTNYVNYINNYDTKTRNFGISPFIRLYKQLFNSKLYIFGQGAINLSFGTSPYSYRNTKFDGVVTYDNTISSKSNMYGISLSPGINYFLTDKIALEVFFAGLSINSARTKISEEQNSGTSITVTDHKERNFSSNLNLNLGSINLGVQFFLAKK